MMARMLKPEPVAGMGLPRPGDDPRRGADVLPDGRHGHREPLLDLVHQPQPEVRRAGSSTARSSRAASSATIVWNSCVWTVFVVLLQNLHRLRGRAAAQPAAADERPDALAGAPAVGPARRGRRDPVALHVRPAARPDQFVPDPHRPRRPGRGLARRILDRDGRGDRRRGLEGLSVLDGRLSRRAAERRPRAGRGGDHRRRRAACAGCSTWCSRRCAR